LIDIEVKLGRRVIRPNQFLSEIEREVVKQLQKDITNKLRGISDPETGAAPKITLKGRSLKNLSIEVGGSEALIQEVERRLR